VFHGIAASVRHLFGTDLAGRTVLVQGAGSVGAKLVALLTDAGATVLVSDVEDERARATGGAPVAPEDAIATECDVYAPCALGATLTAGSIPRLRCRIVAGAANNQLETTGDAERLRDAGILYAPDYVINGGGALHGIGLEHLGWSTERLDQEVERIGDTLLEIYAAADADGITTAEAAERLAAERLSSPAASRTTP
jgi:glutamate dehydrogenase/leucine dehydrogenase